MPESFQSGLVTVIVPTYNRADLVVESLESVARQTFRPIELVIVDDGSTDETPDVLTAWIAERAGDAELTVRCLRQKRSGACVARNAGLDASHGEFVQFLDSDDLLHEDRLSRVVEVFRQTSCDYVYTGFTGFCGVCGETLHTPIPRSTGWPPFEALCKGDIWGITVQFTVRRSIVASVGPWDASLAVFQDYDYLVRLLGASDRGTAIPLVLASARRGHEQRVSDVRVSRVGYECFLHGATLQRDGLLARHSPARIRALAVGNFRATSRRVRRPFPDLAERFAELAHSLGAGGSGVWGHAEYLYWRSLYVGWYTFLKTVGAAKRVFLSLPGKDHCDHATACPHQPQAGSAP
jgi:glycosyltransferase involved in cell wall biosynthesis